MTQTVIDINLAFQIVRILVDRVAVKITIDSPLGHSALGSASRPLASTAFSLVNCSAKFKANTWSAEELTHLRRRFFSTLRTEQLREKWCFLAQFVLVRRGEGSANRARGVTERIVIRFRFRMLQQHLVLFLTLKSAEIWYNKLITRKEWTKSWLGCKGKHI